MSGQALHWTDQQAPRPGFQADYSQQYQYLQQDRHRGAALPGQRNSGSYLQHFPRYDDTNQSRGRPKSEGDSGVLAQYVDPFGLQCHDNSRYSGIGRQLGAGTPSRPSAGLKFPLYHETFAAKEKALKAAEEERLREAAKAMKGLKKKRKANVQVSPNFDTNAPRDGGGDYPGDYSNPGHYTGNNNSSHNQPYTSQNGLTLPPRISVRNSLGSYPDSSQQLYRSVPRYAVERDLPPPPREYQYEPKRVRPHSAFIPGDNRALQDLQGGQGVYGRRNPGSSSRFISVPPHGIHHDTRSNRQWPADQRQWYQYITDDDSDIEYETITAEEACRIPQDDFYAKFPKTFRRTTSDGKLKKQMITPKAPESSLREPRANALERYRLNGGNRPGFAPGGTQSFLPRKLKRRQNSKEASI